MSKSITIVIPNRLGENPQVTIESLYRQTFQNFDIVIINDMEGNANKARNCGLSMVNTPYVLFSDNDITWLPNAISDLYNTLAVSPSHSYAYGYYTMEGKNWCNQPFNPGLLKQKNYISTMSLVRTADHPGFDPDIKRLQDWDVWLTMLAKNKTGIYTWTKLFDTKKRAGITYNSISFAEALSAIKTKHNI